jgi:hypothetical protein
LKKYFIGPAAEKFFNLCGYEAEVSNERYEVPSLYQSRGVPEHLLSLTFDAEGYVVLLSRGSDYEEMNCLSDIFQEKARMNSVAGFADPRVRDKNGAVIDKPSPMALWLSPDVQRQFLAPVVAEAAAKGISPFILREAFYDISRFHEASTFKASVVRFVVKKLAGRRVLDFSSGWGDRLAGLLSLQDEIEYYVGVDPNYQLQQGYADMIAALATPANAGKFVMIESPFETCDVPARAAERGLPPDVRFDLVFTSPPYFDYERYGDGKNSSVTTYPSYVDWVVRFLFVSLRRAWDLLEDNGNLALSIGDTNQLLKKRQPYTEATVLFMHGYLPGSSYRGVIAFAGAQAAKARPIWIFAKRGAAAAAAAAAAAEAQPSQAQLARDQLKTHYPAMHKILEEIM